MISEHAARRRLLWVVDWCVIVGLVVVAALSLAGHLPEPVWWLAILSQPRAHFFGAAVLALAWLLAREKRFWTVLALAVVLLNLAVLAPFYFDQDDEGVPAGEAFTVLQLNTSRGAADLSQVENFAADLVFLQEVTPELERALQSPGRLNYQMVRSEPLENTHGSAILVRGGRASKVQVIGSARHQLPATNTRPLLSTEIEFGGRRVQLLNLHVIRPRDRGSHAYQQTELAAVATWSREQVAAGKEVVLIGDFNATPWSVTFKNFLTDSQTRDSMKGFGLQNSWSAIVPGWMGLPIDHAVYSPGSRVVDRQTIEVDGADHRMLVVSFALAKE